MSIGETFDLEPQAVTRSASTCRWAVPTLSRESLEWLEAENAPWTCVRGAETRVLETTEICEACPHWEPRPSGSKTDGNHKTADDQHQSSEAVPATDWFGAGPPPHETT